MGSIQDMLQEVPLAAVLRERVALADQKYEAAIRQVEDLKQKVAALERENAELRAQTPDRKGTPLGDETTRVLVHLFKTNEQTDCDVGAMARALGMERGVLQYHLDRLHEGKLADNVGLNYLHGHDYWALTPEGRRHAVEHKLV